MTALKLTSIGNSVGVMLPKELLVKLGVQKGDTLYAVRSRMGFGSPRRMPNSRRRWRWRGGHEEAPGRAARVGEVTVWLSRELVLAIHDEQLAEHGGAAGVRDEGLLESALARPLIWPATATPTSAELAGPLRARLLPGITRSSTGTSGPPMSRWRRSSR